MVSYSWYCSSGTTQARSPPVLLMIPAHVDLACRRLIAMEVPKVSFRCYGVPFVFLHRPIDNEMCFPKMTTTRLIPYQFKNAQDFILLVILTVFLDVPVWQDGGNENLEVVELFAGVGRICRLSAWAGYRSRGYDILWAPLKNRYSQKRGQFRRPPMDLNGAAGMLFLMKSVE